MCRDVTANDKCMAVFRGTLINLSLSLTIYFFQKFLWPLRSSGPVSFETVEAASRVTGHLMVDSDPGDFAFFGVVYSSFSFVHLWLSPCPYIFSLGSGFILSKMGQFWERRRIFRAFSQAAGQLLIFRNAGKMKAGAERCHRAGISSSSPGQLQ